MRRIEKDLLRILQRIDFWCIVRVDDSSSFAGYPDTLKAKLSSREARLTSRSD